MATALETYFYHNSIRTYTAAFGTLFNNLQIQRPDGSFIKVPLSYSSKQKYDIKQKYEDHDAHLKTILPRMGFRLTGFSRDTTRIQNKHNTIKHSTIDPETSLSTNKQLNPVPYIFNFSLNIKTKILDDMLQIIEQICAWFNSTLNIVIEDNPDLERDTSIQVKLNTQSISDQFEGLMEDPKSLEMELDFELEGYIYMPTESQSVIKTIKLNYHELDPDQFIETDIIGE